MKIAIEPVYDPFGGMYPYVSGIRKFSEHNVREVPSRFHRIFLNRSRAYKRSYKAALLEKGLKGYGALHSMSDPWFMEACSRSRGQGLRWVHTYHIMFFAEDYEKGLASWQEETNSAQIELASKADVRISTSKWMRDHLWEKYDIDTEVVMGGIDVDLCRRARAERFMKRWGVVDPILFVGSIREVKDPALFVELAGRMPERTFVMAGPDLGKENLEEKYGIDVPSNIVFTGKLKREEVLDAMAACELYVLTSRHEGFPQSVLEAMAIGKRAVISSYLGSDEMIPSEDFGFIFEKGNISDLSEAVEKALSASPEIGRNAAERVAREFDWKVLAKKIDRLYEG